MGQKGSLFWELPAMELFLLMQDIYGVPQRDFDRSLSCCCSMQLISSTSKCACSV